MNWILSEEGVYQCHYATREEGNYQVKVRVEGWQDESAETDFRVSEPVIEFSNAGQKVDLLKAMAAITDGQYYSYDDARNIPVTIHREVLQASVAGITPKDYEIWDMPILFVLMIALVGVEWFIRRRSGLA